MTTERKEIYCALGNSELFLAPVANENATVTCSVYKNDFVKILNNGEVEPVFHIADIKITNINCENTERRQAIVADYSPERTMKIISDNGAVSAFITADNKLYFEIEALDDENYPNISIETADNNSQKFEFNDGSIKWYLQKFSGRNVKCETGAAMCINRIETTRKDGIKRVRLCIVFETNFNNEQYVSRSMAKALKCNFDLDRKNLSEAYAKINFDDKVKNYEASLFFGFDKVNLSVFNSKYVSEIPTDRNSNILNMAMLHSSLLNDEFYILLRNICEKYLSFTAKMQCKENYITLNNSCKAKDHYNSFLYLALLILIEKVKNGCDADLKRKYIIPCLIASAEYLKKEFIFTGGKYILDKNNYSFAKLIAFKTTLDAILKHTKKCENYNQYRNIRNNIMNYKSEIKCFKNVFKVDEYEIASFGFLRLNESDFSSKEMKKAENTASLIRKRIAENELSKTLYTKYF